MQHIANAQAHSGNFADALSTARQIEIEGLRIWALIGVASLQAKAEERKAARETFVEACKASQNAEHPFIRAAALSDLVWQIAEAGEYALALEIAEAKESERDRESGRTTVALVQAHVGKFDAAHETLQMITQPSKRSWVFRRIAVLQARLGDSETSRTSFAAAVQNATRQIAKVFKRASTLSGIAKAQARAGFCEDAQSTFALAMQVTRDIDNATSRVRAWEIIAGDQARTGFGDAAVHTALMIPTPQYHRLPKVAAALVSAGDKENFKRLLLPCAQYLDAAYQMCGLLAKLYPKQATAIAEVVKNS